MQPLWKMVQWFFKKLNIELPYNLGICPKEMKAGTQNRYCTPMYITALFIEAQRWEQPKCPSMDEWVSPMWCIHMLITKYYSALKKKKINTWIWIGHMLEFRRVLLCPLEGPRMKASPDTISILNTQTVVLKYHVLLNDRIQNHTDSCQRVFGFICKLRDIQRGTYWSHQEYPASKIQDKEKLQVQQLRSHRRVFLNLFFHLS